MDEERVDATALVVEARALADELDATLLAVQEACALEASRARASAAALTGEVRTGARAMETGSAEVLTSSRELIRRGEASQRRTNLALALSIGLGLAVAMLLTRTITRPLRAAVEAVEAVRGGDEDRRIPVMSGDGSEPWPTRSTRPSSTSPRPGPRWRRR